MASLLDKHTAEIETKLKAVETTVVGQMRSLQEEYDKKHT